MITLGWQAKRLNNELDDNLEVMFKDLKTQKAVGAPQGRASRARFTVHTHGGVHNARLGLVGVGLGLVLEVTLRVLRVMLRVRLRVRRLITSMKLLP